jgi:hypothetical protein
MADATLQKLEEEIALTMTEANNDKLIDLLKNHGLIDAVKIELVVDMKKIQSSQNTITPQLQEALKASSQDKYELMSCCVCFINNTYRLCCGPCSCCS